MPLNNSSGAPQVRPTDIVAQARKYVGTPFRIQGRARAEGRTRSETIDCAGLLVCVAEDLGLADRAGAKILRTDYMDRRREDQTSFLGEECERRLQAKDEKAALEAGDVVTLKAPNAISHCGFLGEGKYGLTLIFAYPVRMTGAIAGRIVEVRFDERWRGRLVKAFTFPGIGG